MYCNPVAWQFDLLRLFVTMSNASWLHCQQATHAPNRSQDRKVVKCDSDLQMLHTLTNKTDDEAYVCWSNVDGEELLSDCAE